jgi:hypothetical protein
VVRERKWGFNQAQPSVFKKEKGQINMIFVIHPSSISISTSLTLPLCRASVSLLYLLGIKQHKL